MGVVIKMIFFKTSPSRGSSVWSTAYNYPWLNKKATPKGGLIDVRSNLFSIG